MQNAFKILEEWPNVDPRILKGSYLPCGKAQLLRNSIKLGDEVSCLRQAVFFLFPCALFLFFCRMYVGMIELIIRHRSLPVEYPYVLYSSNKPTHNPPSKELAIESSPRSSTFWSLSHSLFWMRWRASIKIRLSQSCSQFNWWQPVSVTYLRLVITKDSFSTFPSQIFANKLVSTDIYLSSLQRWAMTKFNIILHNIAQLGPLGLCWIMHYLVIVICGKDLLNRGIVYPPPTKRKNFWKRYN